MSMNSPEQILARKEYWEKPQGGLITTQNVPTKLPTFLAVMWTNLSEQTFHSFARYLGRSQRLIEQAQHEQLCSMSSWPPSHGCLSPPSQYAIPTTFSHPKFELCFFLQLLHSFVAHFSRRNPALFDLAGDLGQAAFFYRHPKRNPSSLGEEASKKPSERQSRKGFKNGP